MNKYQSGYAAISIVTAIGWFVIISSVIGGIAFLSNVDDSLRFIAVFMTVTGVVQGTILLGVGTIGQAILDGSISQQKSENILINIKEAVSGSGAPTHDLQRSDFDNRQEKSNEKVSNLTVYNIADGATLSKEPFFDKNGRVYNTYVAEDGKIRVAKGAEVLEFDSLEKMKEYFGV